MKNMKRILTLMLIGMTLTSYGQKFFSNVTLTDLIKGKSFFLISTNGTDTLAKCTGAQLLTFVKDSMDVSAIQTQSAPSYVITEGTNGKIARTPTALSGFAFGIFSAYSSGTVYSLTNSVARVDFGTTDPEVTLTSAGSYLFIVQGTILYNGATFASNQTITIRLRRSNNTASNIANTDQTITTPIITTYTGTDGALFLPVVVYTTANTNDNLQVFAGLSATPSAGSVQITQCSVMAIRLY